jgi:hypothetical protein
VFGDNHGQQLLAERAAGQLQGIYDFMRSAQVQGLRGSRLFARALAMLDDATLPESLENEGGAFILYCAALIPELLALTPEANARQVLWNRLSEALITSGRPPQHAQAETALVRLLFQHGEKDLPALWAEPDVQHYLVCNWHNDILWFNRERLQALLYWRLVGVLLRNRREYREWPFAAKRRLAACGRSIVELLMTAEDVKYNYHLFQSLTR